MAEPHWKHKLREKCATIFEEMTEQFSFRFKELPSVRGAHVEVAADGVYEVFAPYPVGYVTLAVFLHEVMHVAANDCVGQKKTNLHIEVRAWGGAKAIMAKHGLMWVDSVSSHARACVTSYIKHDSAKVEPGGVPAKIVKALADLDKAGI